MATGSRRSLPPQKPAVTSNVHEGRPCMECYLCKQSQAVYTHPIKWKNQALLTLLKEIEPELDILPDTCICRNCHNSLRLVENTPDNVQPRWTLQGSMSGTCEVPECNQPAWKCTTLVPREDIGTILECTPLGADGCSSEGTRLCVLHYRTLHKHLKPEIYQRKCGVCASKIRGSRYHTCSKPEVFQDHLLERTDFPGRIGAQTKVCTTCYRFSMTVTDSSKSTSTTTDADLQSLIETIRASMPEQPFTITLESDLLEVALKSTAIHVAQELHGNRALTLRSAHNWFVAQVDTLLPMTNLHSPENLGTPRRLLGQLSTTLMHHMSYTCVVKKHGIIIYRQGRELESLSHALFSASASSRSVTEPDTVKACKKINGKIHQLIKTSKADSSLTSFDMTEMIQGIDPILWDAVCLLTQTASEKAGRSDRENSIVVSTRRLFILHQLMFCIDNRCSMPFHMINADLIDCCSGSTELMRIFNRLGVCVSSDTLKRHIQSTVVRIEATGVLQGLNPKFLTVFTMDNVDFLHSNALVYCGNQHRLSYHGTTVQALQTKPSLNSNSANSTTEPTTPPSSTKRLHALLSPINSPSQESQSPANKRVCGRARTGTEFQHQKSTDAVATASYDFHSTMDTTAEPKKLSIEDFRPTGEEEMSVTRLVNFTTVTYLIKNAFSGSCASLQSFLGVGTNTSEPEVGIVKYIDVLDEVADKKETVLHVIGNLYNEYICKHTKQFLLLEGDAKVYDVMQAVKFEYGADLDWLIPYPGDWHLVKNYQICLMKPFFDAGLRDLATLNGYPAQSIQSCGSFKRTHHFLMETWESMFRFMLRNYLQTNSNSSTVEQKLSSTLDQLENDKSGDDTITYCIMRSLSEDLTELQVFAQFETYIEKMSEADDTWKFWKRFVFQDCLPYVGMFMAMRSENWSLRMASLKLMAANFTAFDHPTYQRLISKHIVDVHRMPPALLEYLQKGGFALSISGRKLHSVALDESHEMLINRHVKQAIVRPSEDYIRRMAKYIPTRMKGIENLKQQIFNDPSTEATKQTHLLSPPPDDLKSEENIKSQLHKIEEVDLLPAHVSSNRGLINPFRGVSATEAQSHDLLSFNQIGSEHYESRVRAYYLNEASVVVPIRRKRLQTFGTTQKKKQGKLASLQKEMKKVQKCMRLKIAYANRTGIRADVVGEQYIELPRALCDEDGNLVKGTKSMATHFYQARYRGADLFSHSFPDNYSPDVVILEGMFLVNTHPLTSHHTMADYGDFLMRRFLSPHLQKGCTELHLLFDNPECQEHNPKVFEQQRRDAASKRDHTCSVFAAEAVVPKKWQEMLKCRKCKRGLTTFLSSYICDNIILPRMDQKFITSGATGTADALEITKTPTGKKNDKKHTTVYSSNTSESDTRVWLHAKHSEGRNIFIFSPDTDVYHVGLPLVSPEVQVTVQLSKPGDKELKLLDLNLLLDQLKRDPCLVNIPKEDVPHVIQMLFVCTGCDYISFFSGIGKSYFFKVFLDYANFILGDVRGAFTTRYTQSDIHNQSRITLLPFIRLVGCAYMMKHANAFHGQTPQSLLNSLSQANSAYHQHEQWLDNIRQTIWDRISFENQTIPSMTALEYHWRRSCWIIHMWQQAECRNMVLAPLNGNGWTQKDDENKLCIDWDSEDNMSRVKERVRLLMKGCGCKTGCKTGRCGCRKNGNTCGPGCRCTDCENVCIGEEEALENSIIRFERG